jgi:spermidine synthase
MQPLKTVASEGSWTLRSRGDEFLVQVDGRMLMTSKRHGSEEALAEVGCLRLDYSADELRVLVGGLGFGFTLRAALNVVPRKAQVIVVEVSPAVVAWNKTLVGHLAEHPLDDPRVDVITGDVLRIVSKNRGGFDAILLDVDNGPFAVTKDDNQALYGLVGLANMRAALRPGGRLAIWSAGAQGGFVKQLREAGFRPSVEKTGDGKHLIFVGDT